MIGTPVDHTALSLSGAYIAQIAALIVQPCKGSTGNWTGEGKGGRWRVVDLCIFLFVAGEQWRGHECARVRDHLIALHTSN